VDDGVVVITDSSKGAVVSIDPDGKAGAAIPRALIVLNGVSAERARDAANFVF